MGHECVTNLFMCLIREDPSLFSCQAPTHKCVLNLEVSGKVRCRLGCLVLDLELLILKHHYALVCLSVALVPC